MAENCPSLLCFPPACRFSPAGLRQGPAPRAGWLLGLMENSPSVRQLLDLLTNPPVTVMAVCYVQGSPEPPDPSVLSPEMPEPRHEPGQQLELFLGKKLERDITSCVRALPFQAPWCVTSFTQSISSAQAVPTCLPAPGRGGWRR